MPSLLVRRFSGLQPYATIWQAMQRFSDDRKHDTPDEVWLLQHTPVFTLGQASKPEHLLSPGETPVVHTDRGGQVTWHGPGQLMCYVLLDTRRIQIGARKLVALLENALVATLSQLGVVSHLHQGKPGVYVWQDGREAKVAALGLRIRKQGCYHGLSLNLDCDLSPFQRINPCGYADMAITRLVDLLDFPPTLDRVESLLIHQLQYALDYDRIEWRVSDG